MNRVVTGYLLTITTALLGLTVWGCFGLTNHIITAVDKLGAAGVGLELTADKLNGPHGTVAMLDEDVGAAKSLIVHADLTARHEQQQLTTWDARGAVLFDNLDGTVNDLRGTIKAITRTSDAATTTLDETQNTVAALNPLLAGSTKTITDLDTLVADPSIVRTLDHVQSMTASGDKIAADAAFETDKLVHPPKKKVTFWGSVYAGVEWLHKVEPPIF